LALVGNHLITKKKDSKQFHNYLISIIISTATIVITVIIVTTVTTVTIVTIVITVTIAAIATTVIIATIAIIVIIITTAIILPPAITVKTRARVYFSEFIYYISIIPLIFLYLFLI
jgi:hypothetical protein